MKQMKKALVYLLILTCIFSTIPLEYTVNAEEQQTNLEPSFTKNGNIIEVTKNGATMSSVLVMYSETAPERQTWVSYYTLGKQRTDVNGSTGYKSVKVTNEITPITCSIAGYYNFWVNSKLYTVYIDQTDIPESGGGQEETPAVDEPIITKENNRIVITKNGVEFDEIKVMYAEQPVARDTWVTYYTTGKLREDINSSKGYKVIKISKESSQLSYYLEGYYYFWINNKEYMVQLTAEDIPEYTSASVENSNNNITICENNSNITSLRYIYTDADYTYTTEEDFINKGKENTNKNSAKGYLTISAPYDGKIITVNKAGFYTFLINDDSGLHGETIQITVEDAPAVSEGSITLDGNVVTIHDNGSNLVGAWYMYTDTDYSYTTSADFISTGKQNPEINGTVGYKTVAGVKVDELVSYDGVQVTIETPGYYTFQLKDDSGKHGQTVYVDEESIEGTKPKVTVTDNTINVTTAELEGWTLSAVNYIYTADTYTYTTWYNFVTTGKLNKTINSTKGYLTAIAAEGELDITCKAPGYYTLLMSYKDTPENESDEQITKTATKTVYVGKYLAEIKLTVDGEAVNADGIKENATNLYLYDIVSGGYTVLYNSKLGYFSSIVDGGKTYQLYYGNTTSKTELGATIADTTPSIKLNYYTTKLNVTDLDATALPMALGGSDYTITLSTGSRTGKGLPSKVTVRQEGQEVPYEYNNSTGVITIPNVSGRITVKAMASKRYNHININLQSMGGNIYDFTWGDPVNYVYTASDVSGGALMLPVPSAPAGSETVTFDGWYTDMNYTTKVTSVNTDNYTEGQTVTYYAKWIYSSTNYYSDSMYYGYKSSIFDIRGYMSKSLIKTTYGDGGYRNYYYYNNGAAYPYTSNSTSNYAGSTWTFPASVGSSIFTKLSGTDLYYAQVMAVQGSYVTVNYILVNTGTSQIKNFTFGACADVQINTNDSAAINVGTDANGTYLVMEDGSKYAFRLYTLDADQYWIGGYSSSYCYNGKGYQSNVFNSSSMNSNHYDKKFVLGRDSALAFSFINETIPQGGTSIKSIKLGVGSISEMGKNSGASVTLIGSGGTFSGALTKVLSSTSSTVSLSGATPTREGYIFKGWNTSPGGTGTGYSANAVVTSATLYAQWEKIEAPSYTVYNKSSVKNAQGKTVASEKADITIFYNSGQDTIDQNNYEVDIVNTDNDFTATLKLTSEDGGFCLPDNVTVTVGSSTLVEGTDYVYNHIENADTADLTIYASRLTDMVKVTAVGIPTPVVVPNVAITPLREIDLKATLTETLDVTNLAQEDQTYTYRWYMAETNRNNEGTALSQTTKTLSLSSATTCKAGTYYYYCVVTTKRIDNNQSARVVSDVITVVVNKSEVTESHVIVDNDTKAVSVSKNPGKATVNYEYYTDAECTTKTSATEGAGVAGGKPMVNGTYYVKALIAESANYLSYETAAVQYKVAGLPVVMQDGRHITIKNNTSGLSSYKYIYTPDFYEYTTWNQFVTTGKLNTDVNGNLGYRGKSGTVDGTSSTLDNTKFDLTTAGYYTFLLTYDGGKTMTTCVLVSEPDLLSDIPYVTQEYVNNNYGILVNNNEDNPASLTSARYIFTGTEEFTTKKWAEFVAKGKEKVNYNTNTGYRVVKIDPTAENPTLDGKEVLLPREGYYLFWLTYTDVNGDVKETQMVVHAGQDITGLTNVGMNVTYLDTASYGTINSIYYQFCGQNEPEVVTSGTQSFTAQTKAATNVSRTEAGVEIEFQVNQYGWYLVRVMDTGEVGTKYYKIKIDKETTDDYKIVLSIDGGVITASDSEDPSNLITKIKFAQDETYTKGNTIKATATGLYQISVVDSKGFTYDLIANVLTLEQSSTINIDTLEKQITNANKVLAGCQIVDSLDGLTRAGTYASQSAADTLQAAITAAEEAKEAKVSQTAVDAAYKSLTTAITTFKNGIVTVSADLITVNNNTITVSPATEEYQLTSVIYNVDNKTSKQLIPLTWGAWAGISSQAYVTNTSFTDGELVFTNVENGIYTFLITQNEAGTKKQYVRYAVVHNNSTEKAVSKTELERYLEAARTVIASGARGIDAANAGEKYVIEAVYDALQNAITDATNMASELASSDNNLNTYDDIIPQIVKLQSAMLSFKNGVKEKPAEDATELTINAADYSNITISKSDLSRVSVAYGNYTTWAKFSKAGYTTLAVSDGKATYTSALYNGTYTALCTYTDGTQVYKTFEVSGIAYPFVVTQANGTITLNLQETQAVEIGFGYGELTDSSSTAFLPISMTDGKSKYNVPALGNGVHTVYVKTADRIYYQQINVDSCTGPVVVQYNGKIGIFTNGFTYSYVAYNTGTHTSWSDMYSGAQYCGQNQWYTLSSFPEDQYTFYFNGTGTTESTLVTYTVVR